MMLKTTVALWIICAILIVVSVKVLGPHNEVEETAEEVLKIEISE